ncbi:hypothetical protein QNI16_05240 [Cytophagaceae bacterium YF14B1]|uniref:Uncharacterized protein n=1 Tax=Xanthocytophaga flava TaxID=3048013 RepID=A0AAE3QJA1_9BACT|nr:hypothetical protein [Xanthocytophaga flavus]MDJ1479880.1 hypothetical protein [Xanthocytophaga flavus]
MNRRLVIYVDTDFLMAGVKPFDTFIPIVVRDIFRIPLFFFVDPSSSKIFYGERYRQEYEDGQPNTYGNFLQSILDDKLHYQAFQYRVPVVELLKVIMDDLRRQYLSILGELTSSLDPTAAIPVSLLFSDNVSTNSQKVFADYLQRIGYEVDQTTFIPAEALALSLFENGKLSHPLQKKIVIAEAFNENLNYSLVQCYNASAVERIATHTYPLMGVDSRINVVASYAVNYINNQRRLLSSKEEIDKEIKRHFRMAKEWTRQMDSDVRPFIDVKSNFAIEKSAENKVVLKKDEIEQQVTYHVRSLGQTFDQFLTNNNHRTEDIDKIILVGESLCNSQELKLEFSRFGAQKLLLCNETDEKGILNGVFLRKQYQEKPQTAPQPVEQNIPSSHVPPPSLQFETVVVTTQLSIGQQLEIGWNDRMIRALHLGNSLFVVVKHYNSQIITGDQFSIDTLLFGQKPVFRNIMRSGKSLGDYTPSGTLNVLKKV